MSSPPEQKEDKSKDKSSILHIDNAINHCTAEVKKFDFYTFIGGQYMPKSTQPYYYGIHAMFLEALKSREVSKEGSIC